MDKDILEWHNQWSLIDDFTEEDIKVIKFVKPYTMTIPVRIHALINAVKYIIQNNIPGDFVECGVWKGGSMMAVAKVLVSMESYDRNLYLFDTYEGMTKPGNIDKNYLGNDAIDRFENERISDNSSTWAYAGLKEVKSNMSLTKYDVDKIHYIKGKVEDTIPSNAPERISLLRLDTDFYESTKHELNHLFPRLSRGGILIIDDYGHWLGSKIATDEYFFQNNIPIFFNRVDYAARLGIKI